MPKRLCLEAGCANPASYRGRCTEHARVNDREINRAGHKVYRQRRWKYARRRQLVDCPVCVCGKLAEHVHHIKDIADGGDPWDSANLQSLCASCHGRITRANQ